MRNVKILALVVAVVSLLVLAGVASAHAFRANSEVTIRYNADKEQFHGRVSSERPSCERNRVVVVFRDTPGEDVEVGRDRTNENGFWKVEATNPQGDFYARARRRVRGTGDHVHICRRDTSPTITVGNAGPGGPA